MDNLGKKIKRLTMVLILMVSAMPLDVEATTSITKTQSEETASLLELINESLHENTEEEDQVSLAETFLDTLSEKQQELVRNELTEENATTWSNVPATYENRNGMSLGDLSEESIKAALKLMKASLSEEGYQTLTEIMKADAFLHTEYKDDTLGSGMYFISFLGTPSDNEPWMVQFSGHHLAENLVFNGKEAGATPQFTGVEPRAFTMWDNVTYRPIDDRITSMEAMLGSLNDEQLKNAEMEEKFDEVVVGPEEDGNYPETVGIPYADLDKKQQTFVKKAIKAWVDDASDEAGGALLNAYFSEDALQNTHIAWSGSPDVEETGAYVRIDGPRVWIELTSREGESHPDNPHYHTVWRDKVADYGGLFAE
ncbi:DUF3500 domain-containing protein [Salicibibacter cibarius]|uniref:DUF3500 domain-containing protein n=1 Tax=Salicibibacter cibarius TaxID=2743000 RepID=A0A7T6Z1A7_9BACI|nr:DUF3500 domain-containing protein [Salicibibacter cibarius]QQK74963.1 DUF3500 domain-containing protein [Salicibibacter cibarius]